MSNRSVPSRASERSPRNRPGPGGSRGRQSGAQSSTDRAAPSVVAFAWLPPLLLAIYGLGFAATALGGGVLAFDDHPGQLYRLSHALTVGLAPWRLNPGWWAGYAELQYYPPGFSYV